MRLVGCRCRGERRRAQLSGEIDCRLDAPAAAAAAEVQGNRMRPLASRAVRFKGGFNQGRVGVRVASSSFRARSVADSWSDFKLRK